MAPVQLAMPVNKFRSGRRTRVRLAGLHTTEGALTMESLVGFLRGTTKQASYHAGTDMAKLGYMVDRGNEAWHMRNGNPMTDGFVFCGFARWSRAEWFDRMPMLENGAWWVASVCRERGIPIRWLSVNEVRDAVRNPNHPGGVCDHDDYSDATGDGTHWDCGEGLPKDFIIDRAREIYSGQADGGLPVTPVRRIEEPVSVISLPQTPFPPHRDDPTKPALWPDQTDLPSEQWPQVEKVIHTGFPLGWHGNLIARVVVGPGGGHLARAHFDRPGPHVHGWIDWPGMYMEPPNAQRNDIFFDFKARKVPAAPYALMITYASPWGDGSLNLEYEL